MTLNTARQGIPYPEQTNVKDEVLQMAAMSAVADDKYILRFTSAGARNAAMPTPAEGVHAYLIAEDQMTFYNGTAWIPLLNGKVVVKLANEITGSIIRQPDDYLKFVGVANAVYQYDLWASYYSDSINQAILAINWTTPAGATVRRGIVAQAPAGNNNNFNAKMGLDDAQAADVRGAGGTTVAGATIAYIERGIIRMSSTGGTVQLVWGVNSGINVSVGQGSNLTIRRLT